jgi:hypothetical protein
MSEEDRLLYHSAIEVKRSLFWAHLIDRLDREANDANAELLQSTMKGEDKRAVIAACKIQAIGVVMGYIQEVISEIEVTVPDQEQEEYDADEYHAG